MNTWVAVRIAKIAQKPVYAENAGDGVWRYWVEPTQPEDWTYKVWADGTVIRHP